MVIVIGSVFLMVSGSLESVSSSSTVIVVTFLLFSFPSESSVELTTVSRLSGSMEKSSKLSKLSISFVILSDIFGGSTEVSLICSDAFSATTNVFCFFLKHWGHTCAILVAPALFFGVFTMLVVKLVGLKGFKPCCFRLVAGFVSLIGFKP